MKKAICIGVLLLAPLALTGCDEQKAMNNVIVAIEGVDTGATALYGSLQIAYMGGQIPDEKWVLFLSAWTKYEALHQTAEDIVTTWKAGAGKPPVERLTAILKNLNVLIKELQSLCLNVELIESSPARSVNERTAAE